MYKRKDFPKKGELVFCTVEEVSNIGIKVKLDEYENGHGIIPIDEISHKRVKNIKKVVGVGQKVVCLVLDSDPSNRIATLSLKRVNKNQRILKLYQIKRERLAYNIIVLLSQRKNIPIEKLKKEIIEKIIDSGKLLYEVWEEAYIEGKDILKKYDIPEEYIEDLYTLIKEEFTVPKYKRKIVLEMYTLASDGIFRLKNLLKEISNLGVNILYAGAPTYILKLESYNPKELDIKVKKINEILKNKAKELEIVYEIREE